MQSPHSIFEAHEPLPQKIGHSGLAPPLALCVPDPGVIRSANQ
jgi:hypothetical protein